MLDTGVYDVKSSTPTRTGKLRAYKGKTGWERGVCPAVGQRGLIILVITLIM